MAGANSNMQVSTLDFASIKTNFTQFLQSQDTFKDYNFSGSALSTLLDVLAYNTQYNAYYLNMVANEVFLDSALQRSSVVSQAKVLNYTPQSAICPTAIVNVVVKGGANNSTLTLPRYSSFISKPINNISYSFTNPDSATSTFVNNTATFSNVILKQGKQASLTFTYSSVANPSSTFNIPNAAADTSTILVEVYPNSTSNNFTVFNPATDFLSLDGTSNVYFLEEANDGTYNIKFGDGILGQALTDGNVVAVSYLYSQGKKSIGANNFSLVSNIGSYTIQTQSVTPSNGGGDKESIASIKFQAPKSFSAQNRAVTKEDYITAIEQNNAGYSFDAVNVWGGEENNPPVYGQVFACLKPAGSYNLTTAQKQDIITNVIKPISVLTVTPNIVDPDYTYIKLGIKVLYDPNLTNLTAAQIQSAVTSAINNFSTVTLNTFNSTFNAYDLLNAIQNVDPSIITSEYILNLEKKFFPNLTKPTTYNLYYNTELQRGTFSSSVRSSPSMNVNSTSSNTVISGVYIEEVPTQTHGVDTVSIISPGFNYTATPTITIKGDGTGANAYATLVNGSIQNIIVTDSGNNYTSAIATVTPAEGDTTGKGAALVVNLQGQTGTLRSYYYNTTNVKTILNPNIGTIDYLNGIITLNSFNVSGVDNPLGQLSIGATPTTSLISSTFDGIITIDPYDPSAITVTVTAKN